MAAGMQRVEVVEGDDDDVTLPGDPSSGGRPDDDARTAPAVCPTTAPARRPGGAVARDAGGSWCWPVCSCSSWGSSSVRP